MPDVTYRAPVPPVVRKIGFADLFFALGQGFKDFKQVPVFGLVIGGIFALVGLMIVLQFNIWGTTWLIFSAAIGFPLIGPFVVVALYEVSHQIELGNKPKWASVLRVVFAQKDRQIPSMAFVVLFFFGIWFSVAHLIFALFMGLSAFTNLSSTGDMFFSSQGLIMLAVGFVVGGALSFILFSLTVISIPLLVDREIDFVTAMITSFKTVIENLPVMLAWGVCVAVLTLVAFIPAFLGLFVVLPILGHATWHLYKRAIEPEL